MSPTTIELVDIYKSIGSTRVLEAVRLPLFPTDRRERGGQKDPHPIMEPVATTTCHSAVSIAYMQPLMDRKERVKNKS